MKDFSQNLANAFFLLLSVFACAGQSVLNAQNAPPTTRKSFAEIVNAPVVYALPGMERTIVKKDIIYRSDAGAELKMDVYAPPDASKAEPRPIVFFIHGGAPPDARPKDWGVFASWGRLAAASGMVGVVFTHRMGFPKPDFALAESDLTHAVEYVRRRAEEFNADRDRVALVSFSAGGPLLSAPLRDAPAHVRALVAFYSFLDVQQSEMHRRAIPDAEVLKKYSPITHLANKSNLPPIFIARAGLDEIPGLNQAADRFIAEALARNVSIEVMNHPRGVHGFDNQIDDARSREIIARSLEFLKTNLVKSN
jgi:acetyl esterase/lipase